MVYPFRCNVYAITKDEGVLMDLKHYPFLDKEIDVAGLEPFEIALIIALPFLLGLVLFIFSPFKVPVVVGIVLSVGGLYVYVRKKKSSKAKGYTYREVVYNLLNGYKKIY